MNIEEIIKDKATKPKEKTDLISNLLLDGTIVAKHLVEFAAREKDAVKATCIEAFEFATKQKPAVADEGVLSFVTAALNEKAPRIKWESAKVIGNMAHLFPTKLDEAISNLLTNSEHAGTVVRWSAAYALGEILKLKTKHNKDLLPAIEAICEREEKNSIRKMYLAAIKALNK